MTELGQYDQAFGKATVAEVLRRFAQDADRSILVCDGKATTIGGLYADVIRLATGFASLGVGRGDRVGLWLENCSAWVVSHLALAYIGAVTVPISTRFREFELARILEHSRAVGLIAHPRLGPLNSGSMLAQMIPGLRDAKDGQVASDRFPNLGFVLGVAFDGDELPVWLTSLEGAKRESPDENATVALTASVNCEDLLYLLYTSGTTGEPKGVMLSQRQVLRKGYYRAQIHKYTAADRMLMLSPLFTISGGVMSLYTTLLSRSTLLLHAHFDPNAAIDIAERQRCTVLHGVQTAIQQMLDVADARGFRSSSIRNVNVAGTPLLPPFLNRVAHVFGGEVSVAYGLTEASGSITYTRLDEHLPHSYFKSGVGLPLPGVEIRIVGRESRKPVPTGRKGEIQVRGYLVMRGYFERADETAKVIDADGWLSTGDWGMLDANSHLHFLGRIKESYRRGGFNVFPIEIEALLEANPAVNRACVVPVPDPRYGEVGVAFIELNRGASTDPSDIVASLRGRIAGYKLPSHVYVVPELPRAAGDKIQRAAMKAEALRLHGSGP